METTLKNIHIGGLDFRIYDTEEGSPVLVFLHYWGGSSQTWKLVFAELAPHFRCIAVDLRGWGDSDKSSTDFSLEKQAGDVAAIIDALELSNYNLVGHSMGGKIAQIVAARQPLGLQHLILVAPAPPTPMKVPQNERAMMLESYQSRAGVEMAISVLTEKELEGSLREQVITDTLKGAAGAKKYWTEAGMLLDISATTGSISVPVTVIVGGKDKVEKEEVLKQELGTRLSQCQFVSLAGVGHLSPLEAPAGVAEAIAAAVHRV